MVEHRSEKPGVDSSILSLGISLWIFRSSKFPGVPQGFLFPFAGGGRIQPQRVKPRRLRTLCRWYTHTFIPRQGSLFATYKKPRFKRGFLQVRA